MLRSQSRTLPGTPLAHIGVKPDVAGVLNVLLMQKETAMETQNTEPGTRSTLQDYEEKIAAQIHAANVRIDEFEAKSKPGRAQAEVAAINGLKVARQNIERMLADLKTTRDAHATRAKTGIDAAIVALQESLEEFRRTFTTQPEKK
jgi:hypothetical protein